MTIEAIDISFENMTLKAGRWRIRYYQAEPQDLEYEKVEWKEIVYDLCKTTPLKSLVLEGYKIGSC